ncbi:hypothetical protein ACSSS7_004279 [Eimeria intestinalis]
MPQGRLTDEASPPNVVASEERAQLRSKTPPGRFRTRHFPPSGFDAPWQVSPQRARGVANDAALGRPHYPPCGPEAFGGNESLEGSFYYNDGGVDLSRSNLSQYVSGNGADYAVSDLSGRKACCRCFRKSKACRRSNSSDCSLADCVCAPHQLRLFCTAGVHGLLLKDGSARAASEATKDHLNGREEQQRREHTSGDASCDAESAVNHGKRAPRCHLCGTFKARPPSGFRVMRDDTLCDFPSRKPTATPSFEGGGVSGHFGRLSSCDDCGCVLSSSHHKGIGTHHLLKQQRPSQKLGEVVAGGVQWGHPTSFWLVESEREEGIEREFRRLFRLNSPESRIALTSCRLLTTLAVVVAALKYGLSTYFPPANQVLERASSMQMPKNAQMALDTIQLARIYRVAFSCRELFFLTRSWNNVATATAEKHPFSRIFFVAYICFTTLTLLNIVTGIILDAYVDMSSRLLKEANYKDDLEKDLHSEKVLLARHRPKFRYVGSDAGDVGLR